MGDGDSTGILLIMMICCCVLLVAATAGGYYFYYGPGATPAATTPSVNLSGLTDTSATPAAASPAAVDPKAALLATGQAIQVAEADISTAPPAFTAPTGLSTTGAVTYTMSMDVNIAQPATTWRNIMGHGDPDFGTATSRRPAVFITGNDAAPPNRIHIVHGATEDNNKNIITTFAATAGTYFNLTWVVNSGTLTTYINGSPDSTGSVSATFNWPSSDQPWRWNAYVAQYPSRAENAVGAVKIKNAYWFNKALTAAEVTTLASAGSGAGTDSGAGSGTSSGSGAGSGTGSGSGSGTGSGSSPPPPPGGMVYVKKVRVERKSGSSNYLHLNQIQIFNQDNTLITGLGASSSSVISNDATNYGANRLIDGTLEHGNKPAHTNASDTEWFQVELPTETIVSKVALYNRTDCCSDRIVGSVVKLINAAGETVKSYDINYNQPVYVWRAPFMDGVQASSSYMPEPFSLGWLSGVPASKPEPPKRRAPDDAVPEPITSGAMDYFGMIE